MTITLSRAEIYALVLIFGLWLANYVWMERDYRQMKAALDLANARVPCEAVPAGEKGTIKRFRYDARKGQLINVETGEVW